MTRVAVYKNPNNGRSIAICDAMAEGIRNVGDRVDVIDESHYRSPTHDVAVFYGLAFRLLNIFREYPRAGKKAVYIDLGYWGRHHNGNRVGYHKFSVNGRHPTAYFQRLKHDATRAALFGLAPGRWARGRNILLAGMGPKACGVEGFGRLEWELKAIQQLKASTDRPILYRPKPSWKHAGNIEGAIFNDPQTDLAKVLKDCHAVVTHHSNVAVDGLVAGVPAFCVQGVAKPLALDDLKAIEAPRYPDDREQWINDIAWTQFNVPEMREGVPWRHLKDEGLVP